MPQHSHTYNVTQHLNLVYKVRRWLTSSILWMWIEINRNKMHNFILSHLRHDSFLISFSFKEEAIITMVTNYPITLCSSPWHCQHIRKFCMYKRSQNLALWHFSPIGNVSRHICVNQSCIRKLSFGEPDQEMTPCYHVSTQVSGFIWWSRLFQKKVKLHFDVRLT